jgi:hypothetical protein
MFSFFKSSKKSPIPSPTEPPKGDDSSQRGSDDFVHVGGNSPHQPMYPSAQLPAPPVPAPYHSPMNRQFSVQASNYTQNVPFKLNPVLSNENSSDIFEFKLREIQQQLNQLSSGGYNNYDFKLERSIVEQ